MSVTLAINKAEVPLIDFTGVLEFMAWNPQFREYMTKPPGQEHYKLLAYLGKKLAQVKAAPVIADIGTLYGASALAFAAAHPTIQVTTYDIVNAVPSAQGIKTINQVANIKRKAMSAQIDIDNISKSDLVLVDIDPHNGIEEDKILKRLVAAGFRGLLLYKDIALNDAMKAFWSSIPASFKKIDLTEVGHWTGSGLVVCDPTYIDLST